MDLLFLTFGPNIRNHYQANFCILSFLKQRHEINTINVLTDHPEFYKHLGDYVRIIPIAKELLQEWRGEYNYLFRVKIKAVEHYILLYGQHPVLYLDSDTFLFANSSEYKKLLEQNVAIMHESEGKLSELKSKSVQRMWNLVQGKSLGGVTITKDHSMWNSGVIGIPVHRNLEAIRLALQVCDDMLRANVTSFMLEQFAVCVALDAIYGLRPASPWIGHYWATKDDWNEAISAFFLESLLKQHSLEQEIERANQFDFKQHPIRKRVKNTRLRLLKLVDRLFPIRPTAFVED